jgi:two-component system, NarL family, nitrate/nitrite response regulator NarL
VREAEVLRGLIEGRSVDELAQEAFVSIATVRSQVRAILRKLGVTSQLAAVGLARRAGWPSDPR